MLVATLELHSLKSRKIFGFLLRRQSHKLKASWKIKSLFLDFPFYPLHDCVLFFLEHLARAATFVLISRVILKEWIHSWSFLSLTLLRARRVCWCDRLRLFRDRSYQHTAEYLSKTRISLSAVCAEKRVWIELSKKNPESEMERRRRQAWRFILIGCIADVFHIVPL